MWIVLIALLLAAPAYADEAKPQEEAKWEIHVTGISHHWRHDDNDNDINMGLGLEYRFRPDLGVVGGFFHNSNGNIAEYLLLRYQPLHLGPVHVGGLVGTVNHYDVDDGNFIPAVLAAVSVDLGRHAEVSVVTLPSIGHRVDGFISVQLGWRF
jgi:hypothetical protein